MFKVTIYRTNGDSERAFWSVDRIIRFQETLATWMKQDANRLKMGNSTMTVVVHDCEVL